MSLINVGSMSSYLKHEHKKNQFKIKIDMKAGRIYMEDKLIVQPIRNGSFYFCTVSNSISRNTASDKRTQLSNVL